jgi:hypothetical protein
MRRRLRRDGTATHDPLWADGDAVEPELDVAAHRLDAQYETAHVREPVTYFFTPQAPLPALAGPAVAGVPHSPQSTRCPLRITWGTAPSAASWRATVS